MRTIVRNLMRRYPAVSRPIWRHLFPLVARPQRWAGKEYTGSRAEAFETIYRENRWRNAESVSGSGSAIESTGMMQGVLDRAIARTGARTLLDAPCGDFNWMRHIALPAGTQYIGGEIVGELAVKLQDEHGSAERRFVHLDIATDPLPDADLWLCRHVLFHLSNADIAAVLRNFARSNVGYLLADDFAFANNDADIQSGGFRFYNLRKPPFALPRPITTYAHFDPPEAPCDLALWSREQIARTVAGWDRSSTTGDDAAR